MGDLKKRLLFLFGALIVYRIGAHIPVPGLDPIALESFFRSQGARYHVSLYLRWVSCPIFLPQLSCNC